MEKLDETQLLSVLGGYNKEKCRRVEYIANHYASIMDDSDWDLWCDAYNAMCL